MSKLTAETLKNEFWNTLTELRAGSISPSVADSVASQGREILRTVKVELEIAKACNAPATADLRRFAGLIPS